MYQKIRPEEIFQIFGGPKNVEKLGREGRGYTQSIKIQKE